VNLQKAAYLPTISGYYNYTYKLLKPAFDMSPAHMLGLQMNIPVFSSGERRAKVRQAKIDLETTQNNMAMLEDQLSIQFKQLKFNLLSAVESFENQKKNVEVSREVYKSLKTKYEQGVISSLELTTADNNYLKAESDYLTSMLEVLRAQNELNTLTGVVNN
jgi:outer membrane protein TolC